jgi:hypothetical protein
MHVAGFIGLIDTNSRAYPSVVRTQFIYEVARKRSNQAGVVRLSSKSNFCRLQSGKTATHAATAAEDVASMCDNLIWYCCVGDTAASQLLGLRNTSSHSNAVHASLLRGGMS